MDLPPAITWDVRPVRWHALVLAALALCACLVFIGLCVFQGWGASSLVLLLALLVSVLMAVTGLLRAASGQLSWDGARWHWWGAQKAAVLDLACVLDLQNQMLLQIRLEQGTRLCLWLERQGDGVAWSALRRAIVASADVPEEQSALPEV